MSHYLIELALWMLAVFILGCAIGAVARGLFGRPVRKPGSDA